MTRFVDMIRPVAIATAAREVGMDSGDGMMRPAGTGEAALPPSMVAVSRKLLVLGIVSLAALPVLLICGFVAVGIEEQRLQADLARRPKIMVADDRIFWDALDHGADPALVTDMADRYRARAEALARQGVMVVRGDQLTAIPSDFLLAHDRQVSRLLASARQAFSGRRPTEVADISEAATATASTAPRPLSDDVSGNLSEAEAGAEKLAALRAALQALPVISSVGAPVGERIYPDQCDQGAQVDRGGQVGQGAQGDRLASDGVSHDGSAGIGQGGVAARLDPCGIAALPAIVVK
jgi:hypothetical protein